ncbi:hematopoietic progenitor cell antigen CD34 isoform X2 [Pleurodeles waltl]|uniref:hematopoietic progenitor cell antigen CD34 isoform X2 n=1 Tax=Pleurodeles waltl TaxID=8319 RepID=UPI0037094071
MLGLSRVGAPKRMGLFWALICVMNFAGTFQNTTTADVRTIRIADPTSNVTDPAKITTKETTSITIPATDNPTTTSSSVSVRPRGTSAAELTTTEMNATHTLTTEGKTISPFTDEGATANTTSLEKNATDNAFHFSATTETTSKHIDTTEQASPTTVTQPAAKTVSHLPSNTAPPENGELRVDEKTNSIPESKPQTTLIALITTGLVVAALILVAYFLSNRQSWSPGSRRLVSSYSWQNK